MTTPDEERRRRERERALLGLIRRTTSLFGARRAAETARRIASREAAPLVAPIPRVIKAATQARQVIRAKGRGPAPTPAEQALIRQYEEDYRRAPADMKPAYLQRLQAGMRYVAGERPLANVPAERIRGLRTGLYRTEAGSYVWGHDLNLESERRLRQLEESPPPTPLDVLTVGGRAMRPFGGAWPAGERAIENLPEPLRAGAETVTSPFGVGLIGATAATGGGALIPRVALAAGELAGGGMASERAATAARAAGAPAWGQEVAGLAAFPVGMGATRVIARATPRVIGAAERAVPGAVPGAVPRPPTVGPAAGLGAETPITPRQPVRAAAVTGEAGPAAARPEVRPPEAPPPSAPEAPPSRPTAPAPPAGALRVIEDATADLKEQAALSVESGQPPKLRPIRGGAGVGPVTGTALQRRTVSLGRALSTAWRALVRPAALRPPDVQAALETYSLNLTSWMHDSGLMTRLLGRQFRAAGLDTGDLVNAVKGGEGIHPNLRGRTVSVIETPEKYALTSAQRAAIETEQETGRRWLQFARDQGADIGEIQGNYVRHVVEFAGDEARQGNSYRRMVNALQSVQRKRVFPTLDELQRWLDANPELGGRIKTLHWQVLRQTAFEQTAKAASDAALMRDLAPMRWIRPRGVKGIRARPPEGYRRVNLPGFEGKTVVIKPAEGKPITTRVGDWYLPEGAASALESQLGALPAGGRAALVPIRIARDIMLNLDASIGTMFGFFKLVGDPVNSLRNLSRMARAIPTNEGFEAFLEEHPQLVRSFFRGGGRLGGRFGEVALREEAPSMLERILPPLRAANRLQFQRIVGVCKLLHFESQVKTMMAMRHLAGNLKVPRVAKWTDAEIIRGAARATMNTYGSIDATQIGLGSVRLLSERMGFLTPGFLRAFTGLFAKTPSAALGDPQGIAQFIFLTQFLAVGSATTAALSYAFTGEWPGADHFDPSSSRFMNINSPWGRFTPAGQVRTYAKLLANLPKDVTEDNLRRVRFFLISRESQPLRVAISQATGRDLFGEPVNLEAFTKKRLGPEPIARAIRAAEDSAPISLQAMLEALGEGGAGPEAFEAMAVSAAGYNFWPIWIREKLDRAAQDAYGKPYAELDPYDKRQLRADHPELESEMRASMADRLRRGDRSAEYFTRVEEINAGYNTRLEQAGQVLSPQDFRVEYGNVQAERRAAIAAYESDPRYADVVKRRRERDADLLTEARDLRAAGKPLDGRHLLAEYGSIFDAHEGEVDRTALFEDLDQYWANLTEREAEKLTMNIGLSLPPIASSYRKDMASLRTYWNIADETWAHMRRQYPSLAAYPTVDAYRRRVEQDMLRRGMVGRMTADAFDPLLRRYNSRVSQTRDRYLRQNPSLNAILTKWYGRLARTTAAQRLAQKEAEERYGVAAR